MKDNGGHKPNKAEDEKVTQQLKVYVTEDEEVSIKNKAELLDMSFSAFARALLLEEEIDVNPKELKRIRYELNKIGVNLNQMAKKVNQREHLPSYQQLEAIHQKIIEVLKQL